MNIDQNALLLLIPVMAAGILLFDLLLLLFNKQMTISRALVRAPWPWQLAVAIGMAVLILHWWTDFF